MTSVGKELRNFWLKQQVAVRSGATTEQLNSFELKYHVRLPQDLRDYFETVNGMEEGESDDEFIEFWAIDKLKRVVEAYGGSGEGDDHHYFIFADWSIRAHDYAIWLSSDTAGPNPVVIADEKPIKAASSFAEFAAGYMRRDYDVLYPRPQQEASHSSSSPRKGCWLKRILGF